MTSDLELHPDLAPAPTTLFASDDPAVIVARATRIAEVIAPLIRQQNLVKRIGQSEHVYVEAWALAGSMLGVFATTIRTWEIGDDAGYGATVEACTINGAVVGRADAVVMRSELVGGKQKWLHAPAFQLISMAQTRASSKSLRMPLGFVMKLAGYETTPAEEMEAAAARGETVSGGKGVRPGWRDKAEQDTGHRRMHAYLDEHGLHDLAAQIMESKGYDRPMSKPQMSDLRRALDRELAERIETSGEGERSGSSLPIAHDSRHDPSPDPKSPPTPPHEEPQVARGGVEGSNQRRREPESAIDLLHKIKDKPGDGPPTVATTPPGEADEPSPGRRPPGGPKRSGRGGQPGASVPAEGKLQEPMGTSSPAGTNQPALIEGDPGRFAR